MPAQKPAFDCPACETASWDWFEYMQLSGWRCGTCEGVIVRQDRPDPDAQ